MKNMKKYLAAILAVLTLIPSFIMPTSAATVLGNYLHTDIVAYIDGYPIQSYNINGYTYIVAEDLLNYGFNVTWYGSQKKLYINPVHSADPATYTTTYSPQKNTKTPGSIAGSYYYTDITTWIGDKQIQGYNIGGFTCICMDDLATYFAKNYVWNGIEKSISLTVGEYRSECDRNGHTYNSGSCTEAKKCIVCGITSGLPLGHTTNSGTCSRCGIVFFKPVTYTGSGKSVVTGVNLDNGLYKITLQHSGNSNFIVRPYDGDGDSFSSWVNEIGAYTGSVVHTDAITNGYLDIKADGNWTITIETITNYGTSNISGYGDCVSPFFELPSGVQVVTLKNTGNSNFIVCLYDSTGKRYSSLVNEIGGYSGQTIFNKGDDTLKYCIEVVSSGQWSVDFGLGETVTNCKQQPNTTGTQTENNVDENSSIDNIKWSASEAKELNTHAANATSSYNTALEYVNKALSSSYTSSIYTSYVINYMSKAQQSLEKAVSLLSINAELELTGGNYNNVSELAKDLMDNVESFVSKYSRSGSSSTTALSMGTDLSKLGIMFLSFQKYTVDLIGQFVH